MNNNYYPISFRTVDAIDYKKAMLIFYEKNNISAIKKIFIEQFEFAIKKYFKKALKKRKISKLLKFDVHFCNNSYHS